MVVVVDVVERAEQRHRLGGGMSQPVTGDKQQRHGPVSMTVCQHGDRGARPAGLPSCGPLAAAGLIAPPPHLCERVLGGVGEVRPPLVRVVVATQALATRREGTQMDGSGSSSSVSSKQACGHQVPHQGGTYLPA